MRAYVARTHNECKRPSPPPPPTELEEAGLDWTNSLPPKTRM